PVAAPLRLAGGRTPGHPQRCLGRRDRRRLHRPDARTREGRSGRDRGAAMSVDTCIVGAGSSGVAVPKALLQRRLAFDCFEKGSDIGGMWGYQNDNRMSSAYRRLHIDTSRKSLGYPDFPIPDHMPDFLSHEQTLQYLEA